MHTFDTNQIYRQDTDGGGTFTVWLDDGRIKKIKQIIFFSSGQFITTVYLNEDQPLLISEKEKHYQWNEDESGFDYDKKLNTDYSELIYAYNWEKDPIQVETNGKSLRREAICGLSDYIGLLQTAQNLVK